MEIKVFTVYDSKAESFLQPFYAPTTAVGLRMFESACRDVQHDFNRYSGDYTLFEIAAFSQETGKFENHGSAINLGLAVQYVQSPQE